MDCVIPGHSVRPFCSSIGCLSRIGKDLYLEFDVIEGLSLRTINDSKSAFASFRFESSFFERCTAPPQQLTNKRRRRSTQETNASSSQGEEDRFSCRVSLRALAAVVKPRKGVAGLRIKNEIIADAFFVSFEFQIQHQDALMSVVHRMKAADATGVTPVAPTEDASEIRGSPKVLLRLLEPLKNTNQAALVIRHDAQCVSASSFHHTDTSVMTNTSASQNAVLQATHASILKTETAVGCDEFFDFDFHQNRGREEDGGERDENMPDDVNSEVILVFSIKEAKSMLQYCAHSHLDHELDVTLYFHWGGRPLVLDAKGESLSARLVLATLDHELLKPLHGTQDEN